MNFKLISFFLAFTLMVVSSNAFSTTRSPQTQNETVSKGPEIESETEASTYIERYRERPLLFIKFISYLIHADDVEDMGNSTNDQLELTDEVNARCRARVCRCNRRICSCWCLRR